MTQFAHLSLHTEYSIDDSIVRIKDLATNTLERGMRAVAVTDKCNLFALWKFQEEMRRKGVKPIFGVDMRVFVSSEIEDRAILLAKNESGLNSLRKLMTAAYTNAESHSRITLDCLFAHHDDLIVLSGGVRGGIGRLLLKGDAVQAEQVAKQYVDKFGDRFYIELTRTGREQEDTYIAHVVPLADSLQIPLVATNDVCFLDASDFGMHETRYCISHRERVGSGIHDQHYSAEQYLRSPEEMRERFRDLPDAVDNAAEIAVRCTTRMKVGRYLPAYKSERSETPEELLDAFAVEALESVLVRNESVGRKFDERSAYEARLHTELDIIKSMGFAGYFLIVMDFVRWAKDRNIPVGPGRGSGAASLVAYVLGITEIDPIEHRLMFERLLNPERVSLPDFDIDFCIHRRNEVIQYVTDHYGKQRVGQIVTFGTLAAKAVIRDVARVHGKPYSLGERISGYVSPRPGTTLTQTLQDEPELSQQMQSDAEVREVVNRALELEGLVRNVGSHPGGTVITPGQLDEIVPIYTDNATGDLKSQFDKQDVEDIGLVKFDFLGLKTVTAIAEACDAANVSREPNGEPPLRPSEFPLDDRAVFKMLHKAHSIGVFQLESRGMRRVLVDLRPDSLEDLTALVALYRPGPMQFVDQFVRRKHGKESTEYLHPLLESVLAKTYGVMVYQEDVMTVARELAGFSLGDSDNLRRAMGKKDESVMFEYKEKFIQGCVDNGVDKSIATSIFEYMQPFAQYAFNRAHAVGYALVAYQTAYLKTHYPAEYLAALATCDIGNGKTTCELVDEARRMGLEVVGPSVNESKYGFTGSNERIVVGFGAIKGLPKTHIRAIEEAQQEGGFESLLDLCIRAGFDRRQHKVLESMIACGCMDCLVDEDDIRLARPKLMAQLNIALSAAEERVAQASQPFDDLLGSSSDSVHQLEQPTFKSMPIEDILADERSCLGFFVSGHPMSRFRSELQGVCTHQDVTTLLQARDNQVVGGIVRSIRQRNTRSGKRMLDIVLEDEHGVLEFGMFDDNGSTLDDFPKDGDFAVVECKVVRDKNEHSAVRARAIHTIEEFRIRRKARIEIDVVGNGSQEQVLDRLHHELRDPPRRGCSIVVNYKNNGYSTPIALDQKWRVRPSRELLERLEQDLGSNSVRVAYPNT